MLPRRDVRRGRPPHPALARHLPACSIVALLTTILRQASPDTSSQKEANTNSKLYFVVAAVLFAQGSVALYPACSIVAPLTAVRPIRLNRRAASLPLASLVSPASSTPPISLHPAQSAHCSLPLALLVSPASSTPPFSATGGGGVSEPLAGAGFRSPFRKLPPPGLLPPPGAAGLRNPA